MSYPPFEFEGYDNINFESSVFRSDRHMIVIQDIMDGIKEPIDKNFFKLNTGDFVLVRTRFCQPYKGVVTKSKCGKAYIIETESNGLVTHRLLHPKATISSDRPMIFTPDKHNHSTVFLNEKTMDLSNIDFIREYSKRFGVSVFDIIKNLEENIEKYPEEFI